MLKTLTVACSLFVTTAASATEPPWYGKLACPDADVNDDGVTNVVDAQQVIACVFSPVPRQECDVDWSGEVDVSDVVAVLSVLFSCQALYENSLYPYGYDWTEYQILLAHHSVWDTYDTIIYVGEGWSVDIVDVGVGYYTLSAWHKSGGTVYGTNVTAGLGSVTTFEVSGYKTLFVYSKPWTSPWPQPDTPSSGWFEITYEYPDSL